MISLIRSDVRVSGWRGRAGCLSMQPRRNWRGWAQRAAPLRVHVDEGMKHVAEGPGGDCYGRGARDRARGGAAVREGRGEAGARRPGAVAPRRDGEGTGRERDGRRVHPAAGGREPERGRAALLRRDDREVRAAGHPREQRGDRQPADGHRRHAGGGVGPDDRGEPEVGVPLQQAGGEAVHQAGRRRAASSAWRRRRGRRGMRS